MSTKISAPCVTCGAATMPSDANPYIEQYEVHYNQWRYQCQACGRIWADEAQRHHNSTELKKALKRPRW